MKLAGRPTNKGRVSERETWGGGLVLGLGDKLLRALGSCVCVCVCVCVGNVVSEKDGLGE